MTHPLTHEQQAIIAAALANNQSDPLIIDAKAGAGKTSTLLELCKHLSGATLIQAFNKSIATEIQAKAATLPFSARANLIISTVHSFGLSSFRRAGRSPQVLAGKLNFMLKDQLQRYSSDDDIWRNKGLISRLTSYAKSAGFGIQSTGESFPSISDQLAWQELADHYDLFADLTGDTKEADIIFEARQLLLSNNARTQAVDYDDMIYLPLLNNFPIPSFANVLIDEAQDINSTRRELAFRAATGGRIIAVGDPNQAIYGFTGASIDSLDAIQRRSQASVYPLSICWRCDEAIIKEAQKLVPGIQCSPAKLGKGRVEPIPFLDKPGQLTPIEQGKLAHLELFRGNGAPQTEGEDAAWLELKAKQAGVPGFLTRLRAGDVVLCRLNKPNIAVALRLLRAGRKCKIEGNDIGRRLLQHCQRATDSYQQQPLVDTRLDLEQYKEVEAHRLLQKNKSEATIALFQDELDALLMLVDRCIEQQAKAGYDALEQLVKDLFADDIPARDLILLSSIHKAKGREWPRVFILGVPDYLPFHLAKLDWEREQEDNLRYVAITRAEHELYLVHGVQSALDKGEF